jgi:hypothetical protein
MKITFFIVMTALALTGCSSTYRITSPAAASRLEGKNGEIFLGDTVHYEAKDVHVSGDTISFREAKTDEQKSVAIRDIAIVERTNHSAGAVQGALMGMGGTLIVSSIIAAADAERGRHSVEESGSAGAMRGLFVMGTTLIGSVLGAIGGGLTGRHETYEFDLGTGAVQSRLNASPTVVVVDDPQRIRPVIKAGVDLGNTLNRKSGSFSEGPGYMAGILSGFNLSREARGYYTMGVELNYIVITDYQPNVVLEYPLSTTYKDRYVIDKMHRAGFVDLGILPGYFYPVSVPVTLSWYCGVSVGLGAEKDAINTISITHVPGVYTGVQWSEKEDLYNTGNYIRTAVSGTFGASVYYRSLMIDLRFRTMKMTGGHGYDNFYLSAGYAL